MMVIIAIIITVIYVTAVSLLAGELPVSVSSTVYELGKKWAWVFTVVMFIVPMLLAPSLMSHSKGTEFLAFLTIGGVLGVGAAPLMSGERNTFHYLCAAVSGLASQMLVALNTPLLLLIWLPYICYTLYEKDCKHNLLCVELECMIVIFIYCLI